MIFECAYDGEVKTKNETGTNHLLKKEQSEMPTQITTKYKLDWIIEEKYFNQIVGHQSANLKNLNSLFDVLIEIIPNNKTTLRIEGSLKGVQQCIAEMNSQVEILKKHTCKQLKVDKEYHQHILLTIKDSKEPKLQQALSKVVMIIPSITNISDIIEISGDQNEVENCSKYFLDLVDSWYQEKVLLPKEIYAEFRSKKNKNYIRMLEQQTQTKVQITDNNSNKDCIIITGKKTNVEKARLLIIDYSKILIEKETEKRRQNSCHIIKSLDVNFRLASILSEKNEQWLKDFKSKFQNVKFEQISGNHLKISPTEQVSSPKEWIKKNEAILEAFINEFFFEIIDYDNKKQADEIDDLKLKIENIRKLYLIDFLDRRDIGKLYFVGPRINVDDFAERNETFKRLSKFYQTKIDKNELIIKSIDVPVISDLDKKIQNSIVNKLLIRMQSMFNFRDYSLNVNESRIEIHGMRNDVENSIDCLRKSLPNIKIKQIQLNIPKIDENYLEIINDLLENTEALQSRIYKLFISNGKHLTLAYFSGIESFTDDNVYNEINNLIVDKIICLKLDVTKHSSIILTNKWKIFEQESLNSKVCSNNFRYNLLMGENGFVEIDLFGKKEYVISMKIKILVILSDNELKTKILSLKKQDVIELIYF